MPGLPAPAVTLRPWRTNARLSPASGTTSQTVAERHEVEPVEEVGSSRPSKKPRRRSSLLERHHQHEGDPDSGQVLSGLC